VSAAVESRTPVWVTAEMAAVHLQMQGFLISPATIRKWAQRGHVRSDGPRGSRYDLWSVQEWAEGRDQLKWRLS
jgi:hypothetical protein